jgi:hypothetical protein
VARLRGDAALRLLVLLVGDLAVAQEELSEGVLGRARAGEDDLPLLPVNGPLEMGPPHDELAGLADHRDEAQHVGELYFREISLEDRFIGHRTGGKSTKVLSAES